MIDEHAGREPALELVLASEYEVLLHPVKEPAVSLADLKPYLDVMREAVRELAARTDTPLHLFDGRLDLLGEPEPCEQDTRHEQA